jgi:hypothetical protein
MSSQTTHSNQTTVPEVYPWTHKPTEDWQRYDNHMCQCEICTGAVCVPKDEIERLGPGLTSTGGLREGKHFVCWTCRSQETDLSIHSTLSCILAEKSRRKPETSKSERTFADGSKDLEQNIKRMRAFDFNNHYGPFIGILRSVRWKRAEIYGKTPPPDVWELMKGNAAFDITPT